MQDEYDFRQGKRGAVLPQQGKTRITIYIDDEVLEAFRQRAEQQGHGYQTMMNQALREYLALSLSLWTRPPSGGCSAKSWRRSRTPPRRLCLPRPNHALHLTASSVRSCVAPASGSR